MFCPVLARKMYLRPLPSSHSLPSWLVAVHEGIGQITCKKNLFDGQYSWTDFAHISTSVLDGLVNLHHEMLFRIAGACMPPLIRQHKQLHCHQMQILPRLAPAISSTFRHSFLLRVGYSLSFLGAGAVRVCIGNIYLFNTW